MPAGVVVRVEFDGYQDFIDHLKKIEDVYDAREEGVVAMTHALATEWLANFITEGARYRPWQPLAERTVRERRQKGYGPEHPILEREGSLLSTAIQFFIEADSSGQKRGEDIEASYTVIFNTATLKATGPKAYNQYGGDDLPARPFWYSDGQAYVTVGKALEEWLEGKLS